MKIIFNEYENFLQSTINNEGKYLNFSKLIEDRGTNYDEFKIIINTIQTSLKIIWDKNSKDYDMLFCLTYSHD